MRLVLAILLLVLTSCRSLPERERHTTIIQKDTLIFTKPVRLDTTLKAFSDTIVKRNLTFAYTYDTILQRMKVLVKTKPETIRVPTVRTIEKTIIRTRPEQVKPKQRFSLWFVGIFSGIIASGIILLIVNIKRILKRMFAIPL